MSSIPMTLRNKKQYSDEIREFVLEQIARGGQSIKLYTTSIGSSSPFSASGRWPMIPFTGLSPGRPL